MRTRRRRAPLQHVLVAGGFDEISEINTLLAVLPDDAYGQVIIEADDPAAVPEFAMPARMSVHTVPAAMGSQALRAWMSEWIPTEPDADREVRLWVGSNIGVEAIPEYATLGGLMRSF